MATPKRKGTDDDILEVMPLGAGNEVGRSCVLMKYKGKTIMVFLLLSYLILIDLLNMNSLTVASILPIQDCLLFLTLIW